MKLLNAFSLNMLAEFPSTVKIDEISLERAKEIAAIGIESSIGHADTACVLSCLLGVGVPTLRETVSLCKGSEVLVAQYRGPRLPEGAMRLPAGATIQWLVVKIS